MWMRRWRAACVSRCKAVPRATSRACCACGEYAASIEHAHAGRVAVAIAELRAIERESPLTLTLAQGVSRGERMDLVVQKATELGASGLAPVLAERSVVRLTAQQAERRLNHWRAIAIAACEQSGGNRLPAIAPPVPLKDFLRTSDGSMRLLLSPAATATLADLPRLVSAITVLIGPEGGLAEAEQEAAVAAGFKPVRVGPRVLRTETAAIAALTLLQREFGDL